MSSTGQKTTTSTWSTPHLPLGAVLALALSVSAGSGCGDGEAGLAVPDDGASGSADAGAVLHWRDENHARIPNEIAPADLPEVFAFTVCSVLTRCRPEIWTDLFSNVQACVGYVQKLLRDQEFGGFEASARADRVAFDGREVAACLDDYLDTDCSDLLPERLICADAMPGKVPADEACNADYECEPGTHCRIQSCPGVCATQSSLGAACSNSVQCEDGLECVDKRCEMPLSKGARCNPNRDICANGRLCVRLDALYTECADWADVYSLEEGERCDPIAARTCRLGLYCIYDEAGERVCAKPAEADGPCQLGDPDPCPADQYCNALRAKPYSGRCTPLLEAGASCSSTSVCAIGTACVDAAGAICVPLRGIGEECDADSACYSASCNSATGTCDYGGCVESNPD